MARSQTITAFSTHSKLGLLDQSTILQLDKNANSRTRSCIECGVFEG